jgi:hypothetical protein
MTTSTERMQAHRRRLAEGKVMLTVAVDSVALAEALIEVGLLEPWCEADREQLTRAVEGLLRSLSSARVFTEEISS